MKLRPTVLVAFIREEMGSVRRGGTEAVLEALLRESVNEILIFDPATLSVAHASRAALRNLQIPRAALRHLSLRDCLVKDDLPAFTGLLSALQNGKKRQARIDIRCRRCDGSVYPVTVKLSRPAGIDTSLVIWRASAVGPQPQFSAPVDLQAVLKHIPGMAYQVSCGLDGVAGLCYVSDQSEQVLGINAAALRARPERFFELILEADKPDYSRRLADAGGKHLTFNWEGRIWLEAWEDVKWVSIRVTSRSSAHGRTWDGMLLNVTQSKLAEAEIRHSRAQLSALTAHVESVREQERLHLAREVHDDLGGNLTAVKIGLSWLIRHLPSSETRLFNRATYLDNVVDQTLEAAHRIAASLRPPVLDFGIVFAINWQLQRFARTGDIAIELDAADERVMLSAEAEITVFRIVQEALTNVLKHARATHVKVTLELRENQLHVSVADNGQGIQRRSESEGVQGFGILGMHERANALGGKLDVQAAAPGGTQILLRMPLAAAGATRPRVA